MSDIDTVRLLIADTNSDPSKQILTDTQIESLLDLEDGSVKYAAAAALDAIATSEVLVSKVITSNGLSTNGAAVATALRAGAKTLRDTADSDQVAQVVENGCGWPPELTSWPNGYNGLSSDDYPWWL